MRPSMKCKIRRFNCCHPGLNLCVLRLYLSLMEACEVLNSIRKNDCNNKNKRK